MNEVKTAGKNSLLPSLPSAMKLRQGNIFTSVCQEFCPGGCLPQCMLGYTPRQTPTYPADTPPGQTPPHADTAPGRHPLTRHPPVRHPPPGRHPPLGRHPPQQTATAADGTHPTGMHSCLFQINLLWHYDQGEYFIEIWLKNKKVFQKDRTILMPTLGESVATTRYSFYALLPGPIP